MRPAQRRHPLRTLACTATALLFSAASPAQVTPGMAVPGWLQARIAAYEAQPWREAPISIWQITRQGQAAYFMAAPCCDQYNPLFDANGRQLCSPNGGVHARGDGKCPHPADAGTPVLQVWQHPQSPVRVQNAPQLAKP